MESLQQSSVLEKPILESDILDGSDDDLLTSERFQVYRYRWVVLSLFCLLEMSNALMWITFGI